MLCFFSILLNIESIGFFVEKKRRPVIFPNLSLADKIAFESKKDLRRIDFPIISRSSEKVTTACSKYSCWVQERSKMNRGDKIGQGWARMRKNGQEWT